METSGFSFWGIDISMTKAIYDLLLFSQDGKCAVCETSTPDFSDYFYLKEDVKRLLCRDCGQVHNFSRYISEQRDDKGYRVR
jgi:hypothetical protein